MFTGIVEELGRISAITLAADSSSARVTVAGPLVTGDAAHGDSIAVDGVCLTVVALAEGTFTAELMAETLARTTAGTWAVDTPVNLERSVTPATRLGGHIVQGHVDGVGHVIARKAHDGYDDVTIAVPADLGRFIAPKGAIAVDGISLTVVDVTDVPAESGASGVAHTAVTLGIIPETRAATTMGRREPGDPVNIEVDVMAKYVERLATAAAARVPHHESKESGPR